MEPPDAPTTTQYSSKVYKKGQMRWRDYADPSIRSPIHADRPLKACQDPSASPAPEEVGTGPNRGI